MTIRTLVAGALALGLLAAPQAFAQSAADYPNRPVKIVIPYGAGTLGDTSMRIIAEKLSTQLGQRFIVENNAGAGGVVAAKLVSSSAPDGYTLTMLGNSHAISTAWFKSLPYDIAKDFQPVSKVATFDFVFLAAKDTPFKAMKDVVAYAKANPGKLKIATLSPGTTQSLGVELFKVVAGVDVVGVPFRSSTDAANAVLRGDVDMDLDSYAVLRGLIDDGKLVALASSGKTRAFYLKDVPTAIESGLAGFDVASWNGIAAPAGVPRPIIDKLSKAIAEALSSKEAQDMGKNFGMVMAGSAPEALGDVFKNDVKKWGDLIEKAKIPNHE